MIDPHVVARGYPVTTQEPPPLHEILELRVGVTAHTWIRRTPTGVLGDEVVDHVAREVFFHIEHVVGDAERVRDTTGIGDTVEPATRLGGRCGAGITERLHGSAHDVVPLLDQEGRRH